MKSYDLDQRLLEALADGIDGRGVLRQRLGCMDGDLSEAIRRGRFRGEIDFRALRLTDSCAARIVGERADQGAAVIEPDLPPPPRPRPIAPPASFADPCVGGVTRTRQAGVALAAMALELELADPLTARRALQKAWPAIFADIEALAVEQRTRPFPLLLRIIALGLAGHKGGEG